MVTVPIAARGKIVSLTPFFVVFANSVPNGKRVAAIPESRPHQPLFRRHVHASKNHLLLGVGSDAAPRDSLAGTLAVHGRLGAGAGRATQTSIGEGD